MEPRLVGVPHFLRAILVHNYNVSVLNTYKDFCSLGFDPFLPGRSLNTDTSIFFGKPKSLLKGRLNRDAGTIIAKASNDKSKRVKEQSGSGSETTVARCFGGGISHLSDGGSFGGTELPGRSKSKRQGLLMDALYEARGSLAGSISSP